MTANGDSWNFNSKKPGCYSVFTGCDFSVLKTGIQLERFLKLDACFALFCNKHRTIPHCRNPPQSIVLKYSKTIDWRGKIWMTIIQKGEKIRVTHIQYIQLKTDSIYLLKMDREGFTI